MGTSGSFPGGKEAGGVKLTTHLHLVPRSKNAWSYTSTPQYAFVAWFSVKKKHMDNFTFAFMYIRRVEPVPERISLFVKVKT
jgi:hypothetical protein